MLLNDKNNLSDVSSASASLANLGGYSSNNTSGFITSSQTGTFVDTGHTGTFLTNYSNNVILTGNLQATNYLGILINPVLATIDWNSGTHFVKSLTANTNIAFANTRDALSVQVLLVNTGSWTVNWPSGGNTGVHWPGGNTPTMTTGNRTDIYNFTQFTGVVYGTYVQNYL